MAIEAGQLPEGAVAIEDTVVPAEAAWSARIDHGNCLRLIDLEGQQAIDFLCYNADDPAERYHAANTIKSGIAQLRRIKGQCAHQQLIQDDTQTVHVTARINFIARHVRLLRAHVLGRTNQYAKLRVHRLFGQLLRRRLCNPEVDDFGRWPIVLLANNDVTWLQVAMNNGPLMCMLDTFTDLSKQFEPVT